MTDETPTRPALADIREYSFSSPGEHTGYRVFPDELEQEPEVFFHGTDRRFLKSIVADGFLKSIVADGFRFPPPDKARSVSFARNSSLPLGYASGLGADGVVVAVRFNANNRSVRREESFGLHIDAFDPQPEIVGFCVVRKGTSPEQELTEEKFFEQFAVLEDGLVLVQIQLRSLSENAKLFGSFVRHMRRSICPTTLSPR
jgi:hypothetical protein